MRGFVLFFWGLSGWAQSGVDTPAIGTIVDPSGALRSVQGLAGNFLLGPATVSGVLSAACNQQLCLAKTDSKILSATGEVDAPPGPAIFGLDGGLEGREAVVYFVKPGVFARWRDNTLDSLDWTVSSEVLSIRLQGGETEIAVRRDHDVWIVRPDGSIVDWILDTSGPVLLLAEGVLFATPDEIVLRHRDGSEVRFELASVESIAAMGPHYAAILAGDSVFVIRTDPGRESLYLLPGNSP